MSTWIVDVIMPPTIGAAIDFMMSDPTPWLYMREELCGIKLRFREH